METDSYKALDKVCEELVDLYIPENVTTVQKPTSDKEILSFYRNYVQKNIPVKISGKVFCVT